MERSCASPKTVCRAAQYKSAVVGTIHLIDEGESVALRDTAEAVERGGSCFLVLLELKNVSSTSALLPGVLRGRGSSSNASNVKIQYFEFLKKKLQIWTEFEGFMYEVR